MLKYSLSSATCMTVLLLTLFSGTPTQAQTSSDLIGQRVKSSLNTMVQDVHTAETHAEKRVVLDRFLAKVSRGTTILTAVPLLSEENRAALEVIQARFEKYSGMLHGVSEENVVADGDLDAFASYMQQDLEQASGGVYLSTGAIIIVLLIILILL
jgi:hypothetical protein